MQRALFALIHGQPWQALQYNYFFVVSIPMALCAVLAQWYNFGGRMEPLRRVVFHRYTLYIYVALFCLWWVLRNILGIYSPKRLRPPIARSFFALAPSSCSDARCVG